MGLAAAAKMENFSSENLIGRLEGARSQIEQRFVDGGAVLVTVIEVLTELVALLERIGNSLNEDEAADATARLKNTADLLNNLPADQAGRSESLQSVRKTAQSLVGHVNSMEETLRYLRTFAMTAKITGANIPDFTSFAAEIVERIQFATSEVHALGEQINALEQRIETATAADTGFLDQHFENIPDIVRRLLVNAREIQSQRQSLSDMAEKVAKLARKVQGKVGQTLSAMQVGDITRQRIEHCQGAYSVVDEYLASPEAKPNISQQGRHAISVFVTRLVFELLSQTTDDFNSDTNRVVENIGSFSEDITELLDLYQAMISESGKDTESPIRLMQDDLTAARGVVDGIGVAVADANQLSEGTVATVKALTTNVETIQLVRRDIQYMALNTNLRCSKLGDEARAINVVTAELRAFSSNLDDDAEKILVGLNQLQKEATILGKGQADDGEDDPRNLGASIDAALSNLIDAGTTMDANVEELHRCGEEVASKVARAVSQLDFKAGIGETLTACVEEAGSAYRDDIDLSGLEETLAILSERIGKTYTMAAEREIHASIFGLPSTETPSAQVSQDDDEDLFADELF